MFVHGGSASLHAGDDVGTDGQRRSQAHGRPEREAPTHPFPELEYMGFGDAPLACCFRTRGNGDHLASGVCNPGRFQPFFGSPAIFQRFGSRERLRSHYDQGVVRIETRQPALNGVAVDIGYEMHVAPRARISESGNGKANTPIAATNAHVNDVAPPTLGVGGMDEFEETLTLSRNLGPGRRGSQGGMPGGPAFCYVHNFAVQKPATLFVEVAGL